MASNKLRSKFWLERLMALSAFVWSVGGFNLQVAVLVPGEFTHIIVATTLECIFSSLQTTGFLTGSDEFKEMCDELTQCGIPTVAVPMPAWHWIPCLGGRSVRPILERIDFTVQHLIANEGDVTKIPPYEYTLKDCWDDCWTNPGGIFKVGGSSEVDDFPVVQPRGKFVLPEKLPADVKVGLIGHSAGGWISRVYLSDRNYGGKVYDGTRYIHTLVTLGTPHLDAPGPAFSGIRWVDKEEALVRSLAVASSGFSSNDWGSFTKGAYQFCGFENTTGDGVTPLESAFAYRGAEQLELEEVHHISWRDNRFAKLVSKELTEHHGSGKPWYGSAEVVKQWSQFLKTNTTESDTNTK
eukprot:scaffold2252_cov150-Amphora_coffeaeformis.AAC.8